MKLQNKFGVGIVITVRLSIIVALITIALDSDARPKTNYQEARNYLGACKASKIIIPIYKFGCSEALDYQETVPELKSLSDAAAKAGDARRDLLFQDEEYRLARKEYDESTGDERKAKSEELSNTKYRVHQRLTKESKSYREARRKADEALFISNIRTLEYIINDYEQQGKDFPVDWMDSRSELFVCLNDYKTQPVQEEYQSSQCVLIVKVLTKKDISNEQGSISHHQYDLLVLDRLKGDCPEQLPFLDENITSRFYMEEGKEYLVFIEDVQSIDIVSCCGNSGLVSETQDELKQIIEPGHVSLRATPAAPF